LNGVGFRQIDQENRYPVLQQFKSLFRKFDAGLARLGGRLRSYDEQLAELRAAVAALAVDGAGDPRQREAASRQLEELLTHRAATREESERLLAMYESAVARVVVVEKQIADMSERLRAIESAASRQAGDRR